MSKDIGMGVRKGTVVSFVPTLFGYFLGIPSVQFFFCDLFPLLFFWGGGGRLLAQSPAIFFGAIPIMEYGSTSYNGDGSEKKWLLHACVQSDMLKTLPYMCFDEPYLSFSSVFISNKTAN